MRVTNVRTRSGIVTLPRPAVGGLGPINLIGVMATLVETDTGPVGERLSLTLHGRHLGLLDEAVRGLVPLVVGRDPVFSTAFWTDAWQDNNFIGFKGWP